jgi:hypothetical protein
MYKFFCQSKFLNLLYEIIITNVHQNLIIYYKSMRIIIVYDDFGLGFFLKLLQVQKLVHAIWKIMNNINLQVLFII